MTKPLIEKLSDIAWAYADSNSSAGDVKHGALYRDKFAELILKECLFQCEAVRDEEPLEDTNLAFSNGVSSGASRIKYHIAYEFGIDLYPKRVSTCNNVSSSQNVLEYQG